ncbi:hypothetical protein J437_LFUL017365 [Ladona fulva]|uniref:Uncharacterized protein n=1 Tax=Ladona fulva TaxID=123851 RepID=A0A8K0KP34_LADFU|nr:hypothetical protein J437_LFUL017365 [Ladona fulva]
MLSCRIYLFRELPIFVKVSDDGSLQSEVIRNPSLFPTQIFIFVYSSRYYFLLFYFIPHQRRMRILFKFGWAGYVHALAILILPPIPLSSPSHQPRLGHYG